MLVRTLLFCLLWISAVAGLVFAEARWFAAPDVQRCETNSIRDYLVREIEVTEKAGHAGAAALILMENREVVAQRGFGISIPPERTAFQVASVSKLVTAWGVMKLVQDGKLDLNESVVWPR